MRESPLYKLFRKRSPLQFRYCEGGKRQPRANEDENSLVTDLLWSLVSK